MCVYICTRTYIHRNIHAESMGAPSGGSCGIEPGLMYLFLVI